MRAIKGILLLDIHQLTMDRICLSILDVLPLLYVLFLA